MASVMLNFFRKLTSLRTVKSHEENKESISGHLSKSENFLMKIQKILLWDDPFLSTCCIICVNIVYWLIVNLNLKFYGIVFTIMLLLSFEQLWREHICPLINKTDSNSKLTNLKTSPSKISNSRVLEISSCLKKFQTIMKDAYAKAMLFRRAEPEMFCIWTCLCFLMLSVIGRAVPGVISLYILLMLIMTVPGVFIHFLPPGIISSIYNFIHSSPKDSGGDNDEVEPYLPEISKEAMELLNLAGELQLPNKEDDEEYNDLLLERISARTNDTSDSVCSKLSLFPEPSLMPSPENSMDFSELELPLGGNSDREKSDSNESESNDINFHSKHFDGDSSSEEEFVKGLKLTDRDSEKVKKEKKLESDKNSGATVLNPANLITMGTNLLTTIVNAKNIERGDRESSSDTDSFEMISEEDM